MSWPDGTLIDSFKSKSEQLFVLVINELPQHSEAHNNDDVNCAHRSVMGQCLAEPTQLCSAGTGWKAGARIPLRFTRSCSWRPRPKGGWWPGSHMRPLHAAWLPTTGHLGSKGGYPFHAVVTWCLLLEAVTKVHPDSREGNTLPHSVDKALGLRRHRGAAALGKCSLLLCGEPRRGVAEMTLRKHGAHRICAHMRPRLTCRHPGLPSPCVSRPLSHTRPSTIQSCLRLPRPTRTPSSWGTRPSLLFPACPHSFL